MANIFDILFNRKPKKPDFADVTGRTTTTERTGTGAIRPDFSRAGNAQSASPSGSRPDFGNVSGRVASTERPLRHGGAGSTGTPATRPQAQRYTVVAGDTLSHIAQRFYGDANRWPAIFDANRDKLSDPDRIFPGQVLRIPDDDAVH